MILEIKRMKNNRVSLFCVLACVLCAILGCFLLITLDGYHIKDISLNLLQYSVYTVYTQFGFFIFPVIPIYLISQDYKDKTISFYRELGNTPISYYINKICIVGLYLSIGNVIAALSLSVLYKNFSNFFLFLWKIENVSIYIILIAALLSYLTRNMIMAYGMNFAIWVLSIVLTTVNEYFSLLCFYDASVKRHSTFEQILKVYSAMDNSVFTESIYNVAIFVIIICVIQIFKKRWFKNGI